jgi:hypothetical protein
MITKLKDNEIFVFGSNKVGKHLGGSAKQAHEQFKAEWGIGEGLTGQSYAFPTLDENFKQVSRKELLDSYFNLLICCDNNKDKVFLMTPVGTGIAGFNLEYIKELFNDEHFKKPNNLIKLF